MKLLQIGLVPLLFVMPAAARAQVSDDTQIMVGGFTTATHGAEKSAGVWHVILPSSNKAWAAEWSSGGCGHFQLSVAHDGFEEGATTGWNVEITPIRVVDRAVTFRLRWRRALVNSKPVRSEMATTELTMRPGEARTIDRVSISPSSKTLDGSPCATSDVSLRVSVDNYPAEDFERRLIATDLWLIERLPNGGERSLPVSVRGLPQKTTSFYFDSIADGATSLDILGKVIARPDGELLELVLEVGSRWGPTTFDWRQDGEWPTAWVESRVHVRPDEVVEVALPRLGASSGPFASRLFSLRIRAKQLR